MNVSSFHAAGAKLLLIAVLATAGADVVAAEIAPAVSTRSLVALKPKPLHIVTRAGAQQDGVRNSGVKFSSTQAVVLEFLALKVGSVAAVGESATTAAAISKQSGKPFAVIRRYKTNSEAILALKTKQVDAVFMDMKSSTPAPVRVPE